MKQYLFLFQIGPVQAFIAQARRIEDLYVGSRLLCDIVLAGAKAAEKRGASLVFPAQDSENNDKYQESVSNLFAFTAHSDAPDVLGRFVEHEIRSHWEEKIAARVRDYLQSHDPRPDWTIRFNAQVKRWLEVYWVAVEIQEGKYGEAYEQARQAMSARKNLRHFPQLQGETGRKCTLTGAMAALDLNWQKPSEDIHAIKLRRNEALGAIAAVKRFAQDANVLNRNGEVRHFSDLDKIAAAGRNGTSRADEPLYVAVLHMDGDRMGKFLSSLKKMEEHQEFSKSMSQFARRAHDIVAEYKPAELIYAGGDDILALLPTSKVLECASKLQQEFTKITQSLKGSTQELTMSAGIAIAPSDYPFDLMLDAARRAESLAKKKYGRNAVCVLEVHGVREVEAGMKWDALESINKLIGYFYLKQLSTGLGYDLHRLAHDMGSKEVDTEARRLELRRLLKRRTSEKANDQTKAEILKLADELVNVAEPSGEDADDRNTVEQSWTALANWTILARFLAGRYE